ncbi:MAG: hypothetical protein FJ291_06385 [Planctomycetes bacterium]|nr:hypothetical protein [Planctomycetota bacterium]
MDTKRARLTDGTGTTLPACFEPLAHWSPARDSVKWLRLSFIAPAVRDAAPEYTLTFGDDVVEQPTEAPVRVTQDEGQVLVETGAIGLAVSRKSGGFLSSVSRGGKEVWRASPTDGPYVTDHTGTVFRATLDTQPLMTVEEAGPLRAVVRTEAWHVSAAGDRLNKSVLRYYAYAGQPWIELHWTFIITADTDKVRFADIGLRLAATGPAAVGTEGGSVQLTEGYLLQKKPDLYVVRKKEGDRYIESVRGGKAPGWVSTAAFSLMLRDFWQTFPKELEAQSGSVITHAWPGHGEFNDDWFIEPEKPPLPDTPIEQVAGPNGVRMTAAYFHQLQKFHHGPLLDFHFPDWWRGANVAGDQASKEPNWLAKTITAVGHRSDEFFAIWSRSRMEAGIVKEHAAGTSRTQELLLDFGDDSAAVAARRALFTNPPHVWLKDPKWLETCGVFGPLSVDAAPAWLENSAKSWQMADKNKHYGMWLYGNMPEYFNRDGSTCIYRMTGTGSHYGYFNNNWYLYLTTGRPEHLRYATINTRQWRDVEIVHFTTPEFEGLPEESRKLLGAAHAVSVYPWRLGSCFSFYAGCSPLLFDYYLTGDRRSLEVAQLHMQGILKNDPGKNLSREAGGTNKAVLDWYLHSWDPTFGARLDEAIHWIMTNDPTAEGGKQANPLNWTNFMPMYLQASKDPASGLKHHAAMRDYVLKWADAELDGDNYATGYPGNPGNMLAAAWFATGDRKYLLPYARNLLKYDVPREKWLMPAAPGFGSGVGASRFDEVLFAYAAWREAGEKGLVPKSEGDLPLPPPIRSYRTPVKGVYYGKESVFLLLKEPGKETRVEWGSYHPGTALTLSGPDGARVLEAKTEAGGFKPVPIVVATEGAPGIYRLVAATEPYKFWSSITPHCKHMVEVVEQVAIFGGTDWVFLVPQGTKQFVATVSDGAFILDPAWRKVRGRGDGKPFGIEVAPEHAGKLWRFRPVGHDSRLKLEGVPPYVAPHPDYWFAAPR